MLRALPRYMVSVASSRCAGGGAQWLWHLAAPGWRDQSVEGNLGGHSKRGRTGT